VNIITIGKRLIPVEQIAFVEPSDPSSNPEFKPERDFKGRVILLNRDPLLTEQTPGEFADEHKFDLLAEDHVAVNRLVSYKVETFEPREGFSPAKPFKTRLKWRDPHGIEQSKLLVTEPAAVLALITELSKPSKKHESGRPARRRRPHREPAPMK
jgi:hypothetical protein